MDVWSWVQNVECSQNVDKGAHIIRKTDQILNDLALNREFSLEKQWAEFKPARRMTNVFDWEIGHFFSGQHQPLELKSATKSIEVPFIVWRHFHPRAPATKTCDVTIMAVKGTDTANFTLFIEVANGDWWERAAARHRFKLRQADAQTHWDRLVDGGGQQLMTTV